MARVSISEAGTWLVKVSRPTIYKMINSGKLSYTSVVKHGKGIKAIDTSELIRVFGSLDGVIDDAKSDAESTGINSALVYMIYNIESLYLKLKTMVLKGLLRLEMSILILLRQAMQLLARHKHEPSSPPHSRGGKFWKNPDPAMLEFSLFSGHPGAFLNLPKNRQIREHSSPRKIPIHHAKLKFLQITPYYQLVRFY